MLLTKNTLSLSDSGGDFMFYSFTNEIFDHLIRFIISQYKSTNLVYTNNKCNDKLLHKLIEHLNERKFPVESFDLHFPVTKYFNYYAKSLTPDLTIVSSDSMEPLAFFKIADNISDFVKDGFLDDAYHMNRHSPILLYTPYYIVTVQNEQDQLRFFNVLSILHHGDFSGFSERPDEVTATSSPYRYEILLANERNRLYRNRLIKKDKILHWGQIAFMVIVPMGLIALLILDAMGIYELSELRLITLGIIIICFLIPYLAQVNIKDFSLTFKNSKK